MEKFRPKIEDLPQTMWSVEEASFEDHKDQIIELIQSCKLSADYSHLGETWFIVKKDNKIIGCASIETRENLVHIQSLSVSEDMRKKGIARSLVETIYKKCVNPGQTLIAMTLFWNNPIYRSLGFEHLDPSLKKEDDIGGREKHKYCVVWGKDK
jgi:N-acetylglutamate synthase-like GNAT family acetyltransferase